MLLLRNPGEPIRILMRRKFFRQRGWTRFRPRQATVYQVELRHRRTSERATMGTRLKPLKELLKSLCKYLPIEKQPQRLNHSKVKQQSLLSFGPPSQFAHLQTKRQTRYTEILSQTSRPLSLDSAAEPVPTPSTAYMGVGGQWLSFGAGILGLGGPKLSKKSSIASPQPMVGYFITHS